MHAERPGSGVEHARLTAYCERGSGELSGREGRRGARQRNARR
jgi:hypothetical protein